MTRWFSILLLAVAPMGCVTFSPLTPGSNSDKGVWVAKSTGFLGIQTADQEVLLCTGGSSPSCTKAGGDVTAAKSHQ